MKRYIFVFVAAMVAVWCMGANNSYTPVACKGSTITLTADSADNADFFQWYKDGVKIVDATSASLVVEITDYTQHTYSVTSRVSDPQVGNNLFANGSFESTTFNYGNMTTHTCSDYGYRGVNPNPVYGAGLPTTDIFFICQNTQPHLLWGDFHDNISAADGNSFAVFDAKAGKRAWYAQTATNPNLKLKAGREYVFSYSAVNINQHSQHRLRQATYNNPNGWSQVYCYIWDANVSHHYIGGSMNDWDPSGIAMPGDSVAYYFSQNSILKIYDGTYDRSWGYDELTSTTNFVRDGDNNIKITAAGWYCFKISGNAVTAYKLTQYSFVAGTMNGWNPSGTIMPNNIGVLRLEPGEHKLKVTNGTWTGAHGFSDMLDPSGFTTDGDNNIVFSLAKPSIVRVTLLSNNKVTVSISSVDDILGEYPGQPATQLADGTWTVNLPTDVKSTYKILWNDGTNSNKDEQEYYNSADYQQTLDWHPAKLVFKVKNLSTNEEFPLATIDLDCGENREKHEWIRKQATFTPTVDMNNVEINVTDLTSAEMGNDFGLDYLIFQHNNYDNSRMVDSTVFVVEATTPEFTVTNPAPECSDGAARTLSLGYTITNGAPYYYTIDYENASIPDVGKTELTQKSETGSISLSIPSGIYGTQNATLKITDKDGNCDASKNILFTLNKIPTLSIGTINNILSTATSVDIPYTVPSGSSAKTYSVHFTDSHFADKGGSVSASGGKISIAISSGLATGTYSGTLTVTSTEGCTKVYSISVTVADNLSVQFMNAQQKVCLGETSVSLPYVVNHGTPTHYTLSFSPAGNFTPVSTKTAIPASPLSVSLGGTPAGTYTATMIAYNADDQCTTSTQIVVLGTPSVTINDIADVCPGTESVTAVFSFENADLYDYTFNGGTPVTDQATTGSGNIVIPTASLSNGTYTLSITPKSSDGCVGENASKSFTILKRYNVDTTVVACESFTWHGVTYTSTPTTAPTHNYGTVAGCDSIVTLKLTINPIYNVDTTAVACDSFTWHGVTYTSTPTDAPTHNYGTVAGCDSIVTLYLTVNKSKTSEETIRNCGAYTWEGVEYTTNGDYMLTLEAANGCDSVVTLHLTVLNDSLMYTKWGNLVLCADRNRNLKSYQWYINGAEVPGATGQYMLTDDMTALISVRAITQSGDTLYSCEKTFAEMTTSPDQSKEEYTLPKNTPVRVYSISGRLMGTAEDNVGDVVSHLPAGVYILRTEDRSIRIVLY